jgi:hypothetical protein
MVNTSLRVASTCCLAIWAALWLLFLLIRFSSFDIRIIPGIGPVMLIALVVALVAPVVATVIAGTALLREPRISLNWVIFACSIVAVVGQAMLFMITKWL